MSLALGVLLLSLLAAEELRYGYVLGAANLPCELVGGKRDHVHGRCYTRACYWFNDCGRWAYPSTWRNRIAPGDSIAKTVFWLGQPGGVSGDRYIWAYGKGGGGRHFAAIFHDGRFVDWQDDAPR